MMRYFTPLIVLVLLAVCAITHTNTANAQDIHFSQFYASPLTLNPAMTGNVPGSYRGTVLYRNQWSSIPAPYSTVIASYDMSLFDCALNGDHAGAGIAIFNDRSGDGALSNVTALLSLAYHKALDADGRFAISVGGQAGYTQKKIDFTKLSFEQQIVQFEFDPTLPNGEPVDDNRFQYFDFRAGGMFLAGISERASIYLGGAYNHFTKPEESFLVSSLTAQETNKLNPRLVLHGGGQFDLTSKVSILPSAVFMTQSGTNTSMFGAAFGYNFNQDNRYSRGSYSDNSAIYIGSWYRWDDALVLLLGIDFQSFKFNFSYDVNISDLKTATSSQGGPEVSIIFTGKSNDCARKRGGLDCPRF